MRILCFIVNRANYGRLKSVLQAIQKDKQFDLKLVLTGTVVEAEYGNCAEIIEKRWI